MIRLNRKVEYALMSLKFMARKSAAELTSAKEISDALKLPFDATARVLQAMAHQGLLHVEQGACGGYRIRNGLAGVSFHQLVEIIEGPVEIARCLHGEDCDLLPTCNIRAPLNALNRRLERVYRDISLSEVLSS